MLTPALLALTVLSAAATPPTAAFDLLEIVAALPSGASRARVTMMTNFGEQRRIVAVPVPERLAFPVTIPAAAVLELGVAIQSRIFSVDFIPKSGPVRFRVDLTRADGTSHTLYERVVSLRDEESDRRWFDERIDLSRFAGETGTLTFAVARVDRPDEPGEMTALWSAPRISTAPGPEDWNVLFITIDCLRADHVGAYGYERATTPGLDRLASEGIRFANAFANAPMTLPSLPQIFTSNVFPEPGMKTFVHPIAAGGISSAAIVNNVWLVLWLSRSAVPFDTAISGDLMAERITDDALAWLERHGSGRFALYLHYLDAHTPYGGPTRYARMFADPAYSGPIGDGFGDVDAANSGVFDDADKKRIIALYDGQIRLVDDQLARITELLRARGLLERTIVIVSADHGEELWDHGRFFHGQSLYDELLRVPLIVRLPGARHGGAVVEREVRSIDIAPSIVDWAGLDRPATFTGRPLREALAAPSAPGDALIATATMGQFPTRYGIRTRDWKLVDTIDDGRRQLFDEQTDPQEQRNVAKVEPARLAALASELAVARQPLAEHGVQVRIVGPKSGRASFRLKLVSRSQSGIFETIDRTEGPDDVRISLSADGRDLTIHGATDAAGRGFRFDRRRLLLAALGGKPDPIRARLRADGSNQSSSSILLGTGSPLPETGVFQTTAPEMEATAPPACPPPDEGVRVCLWRHGGTAPEPTPLAPPVADDAARERLRALGYVQ